MHIRQPGAKRHDLRHRHQCFKEDVLIKLEEIARIHLFCKYFAMSETKAIKTKVVVYPATGFMTS